LSASGYQPVSIAQQEWLRDCDAERFGRGQIDNKIELGGLFDWKVGRLRAAQNLIDKVSSAMPNSRVSYTAW
jgi:hypothetical protein